MNHHPVTEDEFEDLYQAASKALEGAWDGARGDLPMDASRAALLALSAVVEALDKKERIVISARDLDAMLNGEEQDAWFAEERLRDALAKYAVRRGVFPSAPAVLITPVHPGPNEQDV